MKKYNLKRFLASLLAVLMLASVTGVSPAVFAEDVGSTPPSQEETVKPVLKDKSGEVLIKSSMSDAEVSELLNKALISNYDQLDDAAKAALQWEYKYYGYTEHGVSSAKQYWGSINGGAPHSFGLINYTQKPLKSLDAGEYKVRLAGTAKEATLVKVDKYSTTLVLNQGVSVPYNMSAAELEKSIINSVIGKNSSTLPADVTSSDFTVCKLINLGLIWGETDLADKNGRPTVDAGDTPTIRVKYKGNDTYKECYADVQITIVKATVKVSMNMFTKAYAGVEEDLSKKALGITLTPNDNEIDIYRIFTGVNTNLETSVNLVLTDDQQAIINKISEIQVKYLHKSEDETLKAMLKEGIKISEVKDAINEVLKYCDNQAAEWLLDKLGLPSLDTIKNLLYVLDKMTELFDDAKICVGLPDHAGLYKAYAIAVNKNYNTGYASGTVLILMNVKNVKIVMNEKFSSKMDAATAAEVAKAPALLQQNDVTVKDQSSLHYLYTGIQSNLKLYQSTTEFPTEPGRYVVTVVTLGGDYLASPVTRSFQITK